MKSHTPGPWQWMPDVFGRLIGPAGEPVLTVTVFDNFPHLTVRDQDWEGPPWQLVPLTETVGHPDVVLIAVAPKLLSACKLMLDCIDGSHAQVMHAAAVMRTAVREAEGGAHVPR